MAGGSAAARIDLRISTPRVSRRRAEPTSARTEWKEGAHVQQSTHQRRRTTKSQDNQSPGTLQSSLWTSRWLCAVVRVLTIASGPGGGHRPQPARAGAPRPIGPIPDAHIRDCSLHWVPSTRPYNTTKHSVQRGPRARGPTIASLRPCMQHPVRLADTRRRDRIVKSLTRRL